MEQILIIEDENLLRESIADFLEFEGYVCINAKDGFQGVSLAKIHLPDLIICDIKMPKMDGHEVLKELQNNPSTSSIPFIFLSALVDKRDVRRGMELGADDYLTKPFLTEDLLAAVRARLSKSKEINRRFDELRTNITLTLPHELRTPLVSILGYSQLLNEKFQLQNDSESLEYSNSIYEAGIRLNKLIQNFIIYTKLKTFNVSSGINEEIETESTLVSFVMLKTIAENIAKKYGREADLVVDGVDGLISMQINDFMILSEELIDNAFKFSKLNSKVEVSLQSAGDNYIFIIKDYGRGMTEEQIKQIDAYKQFDRDKYEQQGIGLGLAITKKLAEVHNAKFEITSEKQKFTKITITFAVGNKV